MKENVMVSVAMITYNHEAFIREAIEGVIMQKTDFPIELVIGEDGSSDKTREICLEFMKNYPDIIRLLPENGNIGMVKNFIKTLCSCKGRYIALCEGDDYWTDEYKLQKQVDGLEKYKNCSFCAHNYLSFYENSNNISINASNVDNSFVFYKNNFWPRTLTTVFRKDIIKDIPFNDFPNFRDSHLFYYAYLKGDLLYYNFIGGIYRIHSGGISSLKSWEEELIPIYHVSFEIAKKFKKKDDKIRYFDISRHFFYKKLKMNKNNNPLNIKHLIDVSLVEFIFYIMKTEIKLVPNRIKKIFAKKIY